MFINRGKRSGIDEEDVRWALTEGAVIPEDAIGSIRVLDRFSFVELDAATPSRRSSGSRARSSRASRSALSTRAASRRQRTARVALRRGGRGGPLAIVYLILEPSSVDLAAQTFRADLFDAHGFLLWNNYWYAGHYLLTYSVLFPPLGAWLGPRMVGALAVVAGAALFAALAYRRYGDRAWLGILWFGAATATMLMANRLTFALGTAIGLGALVAAQRGRAASRDRVSRRCPGSAARWRPSSWPSPAARSPSPGAAASGALLAVGALAPIALLGLAFPTGGYFPFVFTAFLPVPLFAAAALLLLPPEERVLRVGVLVYAACASCSSSSTRRSGPTPPGSARCSAARCSRSASRGAGPSRWRSWRCRSCGGSGPRRCATSRPGRTIHP